MIALNPKQTFPFTLDVQASQPESTRLHFVCRFLSAGMMAEIDQLTDEASGKSGEEEKSLLLKALSLGGVQLSPPAACDLITVTLDVDAEAKFEDRTRIVFKPLEGESLQRAEASKYPIGKIVDRFNAYVVILESAGAKMERAGGSYQWTDATMGELREMTWKICVASRLSAAKQLADLGGEDLWEVLGTAMRNSRLTEIERKKSALQSASAAAAKSASNVRLAGA